MKGNKLFFRIGKVQTKARIEVKTELIEFVGDQFKQLARKNLGLPMKLYHL
jgi:hypothetical protein